MNYKETLFFVAQCLTVSYEKHNRIIIENIIKSGNVDWDNVVKLSTEHYVFPALYCNLKRVNLLSYLPEELVNYMKYITDLNRERNQQIIKQAKELNELLLTNNITPTFLKGTGNLLDGLYEDIGERMIGDIDFIIEPKTANKTLKTLLANHYTYQAKPEKQIGYIKHYNRLIKGDCISAIEAHLEMTLEKYSPIFNYKIIKPQLRKKDTFSLLSYEHQITHTIINKQLNDYGYLYKNIALRNYYDLFLLSYKANTLTSVLKFPAIFIQLNSFLAVSSFIFPNTSKIYFEKNTNVIHYTNLVFKTFDLSKKHKARKKIIRLYINTKIRIKLLIKALYSKGHFLYILNKLRDIRWYQRRFFNR